MKSNNKLVELKNYLSEADKNGIEVSDLTTQINKAIENSKTDKIRIVLMGAFSDGKTTAIAGYLGQKLPEMKIAVSESSDELTHYEVKSLGKDFEIVDTPGLFGTKEREYEGSKVRYSDITRKYLAQAHVIMYVTNAVNPIKDSHSQILHWVLRDLGKLNNTIFVINKMDEAGFELSDKEDFANGERIKSENLISRLQRIINLSESEKESLNVACIAANPFGKGLDYWFANDNKKRYETYSHIESLKKCISKVTKNIDKDSVAQNVCLSTITDVLRDFSKKISIYESGNKKPLEQLKDIEEDAKRKLDNLRRDAKDQKRNLTKALKNKNSNVVYAIKNATMDNFNEVTNEHLGEKGARLTRDIDEIFSEYSEINEESFRSSNISADFDRMSDLSENMLKSCSSFLKNTKVSSDTIKAVRSVVYPSFKFKPWGAIKMAGKIGKAMGFVSIAIDVFCFIKRESEKHKFAKTQAEIIASVNKMFSEIENKYLNDDATYFKYFAPCIDICDQNLSKLQNQIKVLEAAIDYTKTLKRNLNNWYGADIEDVEYTEIKY